MRFVELDGMLRKAGWYVARVKGSHYQYKHPLINKTLTVPNHKGDLSKVVANNILKEAGLK